jgi:hypothetical protein
LGGQWYEDKEQEEGHVAGVLRWARNRYWSLDFWAVGSTSLQPRRYNYRRSDSDASS